MKAQNSQPLFYVLAAVIIGLVLVVGVGLVRQFTSSGEDMQLQEFEESVQFALNDMGTGRTQQSFAVPEQYTDLYLFGTDDPGDLQSPQEAAFVEQFPLAANAISTGNALLLTQSGEYVVFTIEGYSGPHMTRVPVRDGEVSLEFDTRQGQSTVRPAAPRRTVASLDAEITEEETILSDDGGMSLTLPEGAVIDTPDETVDITVSPQNPPDDTQIEFISPVYDVEPEPSLTQGTVSYTLSYPSITAPEDITVYYFDDGWIPVQRPYAIDEDAQTISFNLDFLGDVVLGHEITEELEEEIDLACDFPGRQFDEEITCGNACTRCIIKNRKDVIDFYEVEETWEDTDCEDYDLVVNNWREISPIDSKWAGAYYCNEVCNVVDACVLEQLRDVEKEECPDLSQWDTEYPHGDFGLWMEEIGIDTACQIPEEDNEEDVTETLSAVLNIDPSVIPQGDDFSTEITLSASESYGAVAYAWNILGEHQITQGSTEEDLLVITILGDESIDVELTVTDVHDNTDTATSTIHVQESPEISELIIGVVSTEGVETVHGYDGNRFVDLGYPGENVEAVEVYDDNLFVAGDGHIYKYDSYDWTDLGSVYDGPTPSLTSFADSLYLIVSTNEEVQYWYEGTWDSFNYPYAPGMRQVYGFKDKLFVTHNDGKIFMLQDNVWTQYTGPRDSIKAVTDDGSTTYFGDYTGNVYVYNVETDALDQYAVLDGGDETGDSTIWDIEEIDGNLYVGQIGGRLWQVVEANSLDNTLIGEYAAVYSLAEMDDLLLIASMGGLASYNTTSEEKDSYGLKGRVTEVVVLDLPAPRRFSA